MWPPLELVHLVHCLCKELHTFLIFACGMACHSCYRVWNSPASVVVGWAMLRSGDLAGQFITSILVFCKIAMQTRAFTTVSAQSHTIHFHQNTFGLEHWGFNSHVLDKMVSVISDYRHLTGHCCGLAGQWSMTLWALMHYYSVNPSYQVLWQQAYRTYMFHTIFFHSLLFLQCIFEWWLWCFRWN